MKQPTTKDLNDNLEFLTARCVQLSLGGSIRVDNITVTIANGKATRSFSKRILKDQTAKAIIQRVADMCVFAPSGFVCAIVSHNGIRTQLKAQ